MLATLDRPVVRDQRKLNEHIRMIVDFLSDGQSDEDAAAMCSRGWRSPNWDPDVTTCAAEDCARTHDHSPHPREHQRWQSAVDGSVDRWPRYLVLGVPRAVNTMPLVDRLILRGVLVLGIGRTARATRLTNWVKVAEFAGCSDKTAKAHYEAGLEAIERAVWNDEGEPIW